MVEKWIHVKMMFKKKKKNTCVHSVEHHDESFSLFSRMVWNAFITRLFFFFTTAIEPFTTADENGKYIFEVLEHLDSSRWSVSVNQTQKNKLTAAVRLIFDVFSFCRLILVNYNFN